MGFSSDTRPVIEGGTDGTQIGNVGDRFKVDAAVSSGSGGVVSIDETLTYQDMNASTGGVARNTVFNAGGAFQQIYSYTGSGKIFGILVSLENLIADATKYWQLRLQVDTVEVFIDSNGFNLNDFGTAVLYGWNESITTLAPEWGGISLVQNAFRWRALHNLPMAFTSSFKVFAKHNGDNRKFLAGLVCFLKDS